MVGRGPGKPVRRKSLVSSSLTLSVLLFLVLKKDVSYVILSFIFFFRWILRQLIFRSYQVSSLRQARQRVFR